MEHLKVASLSYTKASLANIRQDWKGMPGINPLAYYEHWVKDREQKFFVTLGPER
jgi:hypothetical protein